MRCIVAFALAILYACSALADPAGFNAGVTRIATTDGATSFDTLVFYPTQQREMPWQAGPFTVDATRDAPLVIQKHLPVVLISHGRGGGPLGHRELAEALARAGFIVVLPTHVGDAAGFPRAATQAAILIERPRQAEAALDAVLADPRFSASADPNRVGIIGHSAGGFTALILAGAKPDFAYASAYCATHDDPGACPPHAVGATQAVKHEDVPAELLDWHAPVDRRVKALVLFDPLAMMFAPSGFSTVRIPTLLYRPQDDSYFNAARNAAVVASSLPAPPVEQVVPGNHFVFIDPCPPAVATRGALVCTDAQGVDRTAVHRAIEHDVIAFLRANL